MIRQGYEKFEADFWKIFEFIEKYKFSIIEKKGDGSFFTLTIKIINCQIETLRVYYEFIEQQLLITLERNGKYETTFEINKTDCLGYEFSDLTPRGDLYIDALQNNAKIVTSVLNSKI